MIGNNFFKRLIFFSIVVCFKILLKPEKRNLRV